MLFWTSIICLQKILIEDNYLSTFLPFLPRFPFLEIIKICDFSKGVFWSICASIIKYLKLVLDNQHLFQSSGDWEDPDQGTGISCMVWAWPVLLRWCLELEQCVLQNNCLLLVPQNNRRENLLIPTSLSCTVALIHSQKLGALIIYITLIKPISERFHWGLDSQHTNSEEHTGMVQQLVHIFRNVNRGGEFCLKNSHQNLLHH